MAPSSPSGGAQASQKWQNYLPVAKQVEFSCGFFAENGMLSQSSVKTFLRGVGLTIREEEFVRKIFANEKNEFAPENQLAPCNPQDAFTSHKYKKDAVLQWYHNVGANSFTHKKEDAEKALETLLPYCGLNTVAGSGAGNSAGTSASRVRWSTFQHLLGTVGSDRLKQQELSRIMSKATITNDSISVGELVQYVASTSAPLNYN